MNYVHGTWNHLFADIAGESEVRFVFDTNENKLLVGQICTNRSLSQDNKGWKPLNAIQMDDLFDSLTHGNEEIFDCPADHGLEWTDELPSWAQFA
jgi:hypothetical protein